MKRLRALGLRPEVLLSGAPGSTDPSEPLSSTAYQALYRPIEAEDQWDEMAGRLASWRQMYLSTVVPSGVFDDPELGVWLSEVQTVLLHPNSYERGTP